MKLNELVAIIDPERAGTNDLRIAFDTFGNVQEISSDCSEIMEALNGYEVSELGVTTGQFNILLSRPEDDKKMGRLDFVKKVIETHIDDALCGIFFTRNVVGDPMTPLDKGFGIDIEICYPYEYFEIFGLTDSEQKTIESFYDRLNERQRTARNGEEEAK